MAIIGSKGVLLSAVTAAALCGAAFPASGQDAVIAACQALPTETERFDCLADALRLASGQATLSADDVAAAIQAPAAAEPSAQPSAASPTVVPAVAAPAAPAVASESRRSGLRLPFFGGGSDDEPARVSSTSIAATGLGAEQVAVREGGGRPAPTVMAAAVVSSDVVGYKQLQVELDNGQVWRQAQAEEPWDDILDDAPEQVEIWATRFGGYRMRLVGQDRTMLVERVR
jgi:hypothetical protein